MMNELIGKKLLILGGIKYECDIVEHAKKMGVYTIVADYDVNSPAKKIADRAVLVDATDVDAIVDLCKKEKIDGITTGFVDILLPGWFEICNKINRPCYVTPEMLAMSTDKMVFKRTCEDYGVPVPKTYFVGENLTEQVLKSLPYPVFVKPLDASGSRGCKVCDSYDDVVRQFSEAKDFSPTGNVIIEEYLRGREFLLDYVGQDGEFKLIEMFDRYMAHDRDSARNFANVSIAPSFAIDTYYRDIDEKVRTMFKRLGFRDGLIFLQGHIEGDRITFYEMGCRLGGSFFDLEQACLGYNAVDMIIRYALTGKMFEEDMVIDDRAAVFDKYAITSNFLLAGGNQTIAKVKGIDEAKNIPSYVKTLQYREEGDYYAKDSIVDKPIVSIYFTGNSIEEVKERLAYMNRIFEVTNETGESILMEKFDPLELEKY